MIPHTAADHGPFTVCVAVHDGHRRIFTDLADATAYAARLRDLLNVTSSVYDRHGQIVGATEVAQTFNTYEDGAA